MTLIAVTGGIGAGKSTVVTILEHLGARVADADTVAHLSYKPGMPAWRAIVVRWGSQILSANSDIDRIKLAKIVFDTPSELEALNSIVHPVVRAEIKKLEQRDSRPLFCAIPLLYESGWQDYCDSVIAIWCDPQTQRKRLLQRGWSHDEINKRLDSQLSMNEKLTRADYAIISGGTMECLRIQCTAILDSIGR